MTQAADGVNNPSVPRSKGQWRRWAQETRAGIDLGAVSDAVRTVVAAWLETRPPTTVVLYRSMPGEIDLNALADAACSAPPGSPAARHRFATTRTPDGGWLTVHPWDSPLERHRFGYDQPVAGAPAVAANEVGIVLAPGLAFDRRGVRLGHGKGYYDRLLAGLPAATAVGIVATALVVPRLPGEAHDVSMTLLATETGLIAPDR